jgi:hypothetical protein
MRFVLLLVGLSACAVPVPTISALTVDTPMPAPAKVLPAAAAGVVFADAGPEAVEGVTNTVSGGAHQHHHMPAVVDAGTP